MLDEVKNRVSHQLGSDPVRNWVLVEAVSRVVVGLCLFRYRLMQLLVFVVVPSLQEQLVDKVLLDNRQDV